MPWFILVLAGLFEVGWAIGLKYTDGFTRFWPTLGTLAAMVISVGLLGLGHEVVARGNLLRRLGRRRDGRYGRHGDPASR